MHKQITSSSNFGLKLISQAVNFITKFWVENEVYNWGSVTDTGCTQLIDHIQNDFKPNLYRQGRNYSNTKTVVGSVDILSAWRMYGPL